MDLGILNCLVVRIYGIPRAAELLREDLIRRASQRSRLSTPEYDVVVMLEEKFV
jgi:hypothetical protein